MGVHSSEWKRIINYIGKLKMGKFIDLTNLRFGNLLVQHIHDTTTFKKIRWSCICDCGRITYVVGQDLREGKTRSCANINCDFAFTIKSNSSKIYGMSNTPEYNSWALMIQRCTDPNIEAYHIYGGRGIIVSNRWTLPNGIGFSNFYNDLGPKPSNEHSIDRIDFNGNYEPDNCRWSTPKEQAQNQSRTILNPILVKQILWEFKVNGLDAPAIIKKLKIQVSYNSVYYVVKGQTWTNINIDADIIEFNNTKTLPTYII